MEPRRFPNGLVAFQLAVSVLSLWKSIQKTSARKLLRLLPLLLPLLHWRTLLLLDLPVVQCAKVNVCCCHGIALRGFARAAELDRVRLLLLLLP